MANNRKRSKSIVCINDWHRIIVAQYWRINGGHVSVMAVAA